MKEQKEFNAQRHKLLQSVTHFLEGPMVFLGFVWLILLILEFTGKATAATTKVGTAIWLIFIADFLMKFILAPNKALFLRKNILTAVSLLIPAFRLFRAFRAFRLVRLFRGSRLIKVVASLNRGMRSLNATMARRGLKYVLILTVIVTLAGAAGMYTFESETGVLNSYGESLWWTIMVVITIGSDYWPKTAEGRILCLLIAMFGFAVFGYITATLASFFIGRDAEEKDAPLAGSAEIEALRREIAELKEIILQKKGDF